MLDTGSTHSVLTLRAAVKLGWRHCSARVRKVHYAAAAVPGAHTERRSAVAVPPLTTAAPSSPHVVAFPTEVTVAGQASRPPFGTVGVLGADFLGCHDAVCFLWSRHEVVLLSRPSGTAAAAAATEGRQRVCKRVAAAFPRLVRLATPHIFRGIPFIAGTVALPCGAVREARIMIDTGCRRSVLLPDAAATHDVGRDVAEATFVGLSGGGKPASSVIPVTVTLQAASAVGDAAVAGMPKAVVHTGVAVHVMELPTLRQHQKRLSMPVLLLGVEALCTRDSFAYSPWSRQAWM